MTTYLEQAAAELEKARNGNERRLEQAGEMHSGRQEEAALILREVSGRRMELAAAFTRLAAIEAGLPPCCCTGHHGPERETT